MVAVSLQSFFESSGSFLVCFMGVLRLKSPSMAFSSDWVCLLALLLTFQWQVNKVFLMASELERWLKAEDSCKCLEVSAVGPESLTDRLFAPKAVTAECDSRRAASLVFPFFLPLLACITGSTTGPKNQWVPLEKWEEIENEI